jgi:hypothetical protein
VQKITLQTCWEWLMLRYNQHTQRKKFSRRTISFEVNQEVQRCEWGGLKDTSSHAIISYLIKVLNNNWSNRRLRVCLSTLADRIRTIRGSKYKDANVLFGDSSDVVCPTYRMSFDRYQFHNATDLRGAHRQQGVRRLRC